MVDEFFKLVYYYINGSHTLIVLIGRGDGERPHTLSDMSRVLYHLAIQRNMFGAIAGNQTLIF